MSIILQLIVFACAISMFFLKQEKKLAILVITLICFNAITISFVPYGNAYLFVPICFFISELKNLNKNYRQIAHNKLLSVLITIEIVASLFLYIYSPHYFGDTNETIRFILNTLICSYFWIIYSYTATKGSDTLIKLISPIYLSLLILTAFGIVNLITKSGVFVDIAMGGANLEMYGDITAGEIYTDRERFRVQAMFVNPFCYGYICMVLAIFFSYTYLKKFIKKRQFIIAMSCCLFGIITCNCRTIIVCSFIGACVFMMISFKMKRNIKYFIAGIVLCVLSYNFVPFIQDTIDQTLTAFTDTKGQQVSGSNIEMRTMQLARVIYHINGHEVFGRGLDYFVKDLGWGGETKYLVDPDLAGLEGLAFGYLLERGVFGLTVWCIFYMSIIAFFYKRRKLYPYESAFALSLAIIYISYSNMTGELQSHLSTLFFMGILLKILNIKKQNSID